MNDAQESSLEAQSLPQAEAEPVGSKNLIRDFFGVIFDPLKTFRNVLAANYWVGIFIVVLVIASALEVVYHPVMVDMSITQMMKNPQVQDNAEAAQKGEAFLRSPLYRIMMPVTIAVTQAIGILLWAVLAFFLASVVFGGTARFKSVWIVSCWSFVIILLQLIVKTPLILATKTVEAGLNLGLLFSENLVGAKMHSVMGVFDLFGIWFFIVFGLGLAVAYKFSTKKGIGISFIIWLVFSIIGVIRALITSNIA